MVILFPIGGYDWQYTINGNETHLEAVVDSYGVYFSGNGDEVEQKGFPFYIGFILLGLITAATLLSYKNRKRQLAIGRINFVLHLLMALLIVGGLMFGDSLGVSYLTQSENLDKTQVDRMLVDYPIVTQYGIGFFAAITSVPLLFMANIGIRRDEKLVQSLDRLR